MKVLRKTPGHIRRTRGGKVRAASLAAVAALFLFGCSDDDAADTTGDTGDTAEQEAVTIDIVSTSEAFEPDTVTVATGTDVTWVNTDDIAHTSTSQDDQWDSGTLEPGDEFTFTAETAGTYQYVCSIHPSMTGELVVE